MILADACSRKHRVIHRVVPDPEFMDLVSDGSIVTHPWIIGELILGGLAPHSRRLICELEGVDPVTPKRTIEFIERHRPKGIGWVDTHVLVCAVDLGLSIISDDEGLYTNATLHRVQRKMSGPAIVPRGR